MMLVNVLPLCSNFMHRIPIFFLLMYFSPQRVLFFLILLSTALPVKAQLFIETQTDGELLAKKLVGEGISISNVRLTGSALASGFFYVKEGTRIGIDSGIVLSNGRVKTAGGNYGMDAPQFRTASTRLNTPGDDDLSQLVNEVTSDAIVLEFDFVPLGDSIQFRYVFSSEEYPDYVCSPFNDAFAFFLEGPGITGRKNLALVPNTSIPVAINSINSGMPGPNYPLSTCQSMGTGSPFTDYYIDNTGNDYFTHNGHTVVLMAASKVTPCQTYHLKIVISDAGAGAGGQPDRTFDSGVFLEAKSLNSSGITIVNQNPVALNQAYLVEGCQTGSIELTRQKKLPFAQSVSLTYGGTVANGTDVQLLPNTAVIPANDSFVVLPIFPIVDNLPEGIETLKIYVTNDCAGINVFSDSIEIQLKDYDVLSLTPKDSAGFCKNTPVQLAASTGYTSYQWTPSAGLNNAQTRTPVAILEASQMFTCTAIEGTCKARDSVKLVLKKLQLLSKRDVSCASGATGMIKVSGGWAWQTPVTYNINNAAFAQDSTFSNLTTGTYTVRIKDASGCIDSLVVTLEQSAPDLLLSQNSTTASCTGENGFVQLAATGGAAPYLFAIDGGAFGTATGYTITGGAHTLQVKDANGCVTQQAVSILNDAPITVTAAATAAGCTGTADGLLLLSATGGSANYQYSINGNGYQSSPQFAVPVGPVSYSVKDNKGCTATGTVTIPITNNITVDAGERDTICEGNAKQLQAQTNGASVLWSGPALSSPTSLSPVAAPVSSAWYYVTATFGICTQKDSVFIFVYKAPVANAGKDSSICFGRTIQLGASGGVTYNWFPHPDISNPSIPNPTIRPTKNTWYYLNVTDENGCTSIKSDSVLITLVPAVKAFAGRDTAVAIDQPLQLFGRDLGNSGVTTYEWQPIRGLSNNRIPNPVAILQSDVSYILLLTTPEGCEGKDTINIKVYKGPDIYVPTGFTPDNNGRNDVLRAIPIGMKQFNYFKVFNRWGQPVFVTTNPTIGWNGTMKGSFVPTGTFVWIAEAVDFRGNKIMRRGTVTLIR